MEILWKPLGTLWVSLVALLGFRRKPEWSRGAPGGAKGGQGEAKRTLGRLPGEHLGASLVKEECEGKTVKLPEAFDEK